MKAILQVPCYNEAESLPVTLASLPRSLPGIDEVEWLVVDDGSTDGTAEVAKFLGVDHVIVLPKHLGLAAAFEAGLRAALARGADIVVNTDADNQYRSEDIEKLIEPLLDRRADLVIGARPLKTIRHFSPLKRGLQIWGSRALSWWIRAEIPDVRSGFRAFNRRAASRLRVFSRYTYTLETLIQASAEGLRLATVPVRTNDDLRPSRLIRSLPNDLWRSFTAVVGASWRYGLFFGGGRRGALALAPQS